MSYADDFHAGQRNERDYMYSLLTKHPEMTATEVMDNIRRRDKDDIQFNLQKPGYSLQTAVRILQLVDAEPETDCCWVYNSHHISKDKVRTLVLGEAS